MNTIRKETLLHRITGYKWSIALMVALDLSLFEKINEEPLNCMELAKRCKITPEYLYLLLLYFQATNYLKEKDGKWYLESDINIKEWEQMKDINAYESYILKKWMNKENLINTLKSEIGQRPFDHIGWDREGSSLYQKANYNRNMELISIMLRRMVKNIPNKFLLEYGRSNGVLLKVFRSKFNVNFIDGVADIILFYNQIHYLKPEILSEIIAKFKEINKKVAFIIIDYFYDDSDEFSMGLLLDWVTHGGIYYVKKEEILEEMKKNNCELLKSNYIEQISTQIMIFR